VHSCEGDDMRRAGALCAQRPVVAIGEQRVAVGVRPQRVDLRAEIVADPPTEREPLVPIAPVVTDPGTKGCV